MSSPLLGDLTAALLAGAVLVASWWPRPWAPAVAWAPEHPAWDLRWALTLLAALLMAGDSGGPILALGVVPAWMLAGHLATGRFAGAARRFWLVWLWAGYALGPLLALWPNLFAPGAVLWIAGAVAALAGRLLSAAPEAAA